ncbi:hypothetical protein BDV93DRAFT_491604 [Ceratobasidium sp. AG-I]|nr:hypothetical protein BDV93DRAFT_491604 [Ceratobasidium sp. AG-I]
MDAERGPFLPFSAQTPKPSPTAFLLTLARRNTRVVIVAGLASTLFLSSLLYASDVPRAALGFVSSGLSYGGTKGPWPTECSPDDWSDGEWVRKPPAEYPLEHYLSLYPYNASDPAQPKFSPTPDVARHPLAPLGFLGCASGREREWHLGMEGNGTPDKNHPELWGYVVRGASYDWLPRNTACRKYSERVGREQFVRSLVERGGWFLVGDSVTEQQFFSMSCMLYPHVIATPDYAPHGGSGPRDWPQHLYLNPSSPLVRLLKPPAGFDIKRTPLVTFRRVDLLFSTSELDTIHTSIHASSLSAPNSTVPKTLFGPTASESYNLSPGTYLSIFTAPLPEANYRVLLLSTAGHWTTATLPGARDPDNVQEEATNPAVFRTFQEAVRVWTSKVTTALLDSRLSGASPGGVKSQDRQVLIRAYLPGHEYDCHAEPGPLSEVRKFSRDYYNWSWVGKMNEAFRDAIRAGSPQIRYLNVDRPALLRPDAHALSDCLHIQIGAGIFEGWATYVWHFTEDLRRATW